MARKYLKWCDAPIWVKICRNVKDCRRWKGFTPEKLAAKANIDLKRYKRIERALVQDITYDETYRIARALRIDEDNVTHY
ncbi:MAG TPA: helix-turn-helix domain-containing protein [Candidatus Wunengus sp. YC60]|uniref:helix-turn-helix domain-containing protein n=1 Tax=Candidatus Wunengus sp. YC60 TaxID=3367697 RepID=UPI004028110E